MQSLVTAALLLSLTSLATPPAHAQQSLPPGAAAPDDASPAATQNAPKAATVSQDLAAVEDRIGHEQYDAARPELLRYLQAHAADARALYDLGYLDSAANNEEAAEADYRKAVAADPQQFEARLALGLILAGQGDTAAAHEQLAAAVQRTPANDNPAAQAQADRALAQLDVSMGGHMEEARDALVCALKLSPETEGDLLLTARIAAASSDDATAEASYRRLLARQPDSVEGLAGLAHILVQQKKFDQAEPLVRSALVKIPDDSGLNMQFASLLAAEGKTANSTAVLERLHTAEPGNAAVEQMLADAYLAANAPEKAELLLAGLLRAQPDDRELLDEQGQALTRQKRYAEAVRVFEHATLVHPDDVDAWNGLAFTSSELSHEKVVLSALASRAKLAQDTPVTLFLWATSYDKLHQVRPAVEYYQKFLVAAAGKFPDEEWQARHRLVALGQAH